MLPHWLIHPIRAFREDLAKNPVTRLTWGVEPRSEERRRKLRRTIGAHLAAYLTVVAVIMLWRVPDDVWMAPFVYPEDYLLEALTTPRLVFLGAPFIWAPLAILATALAGWNFNKSELEELRLAGVKSGQLLWGHISAQIMGGLFAVSVHMALNAVIVTSYEWFAYGEDGLQSLPALVKGMLLDFIYLMTPVFCFIVGVLTIAALRAMQVPKVQTVLAVLGIAFIGGPFMLWRTAASLSFVFGIGFFFEVLIFIWEGLSWLPATIWLELLSWPFRIWIVVWLWKRAVRKLEGA